jgi:hypothetical protein
MSPRSMSCYATSSCRRGRMPLCAGVAGHLKKRTSKSVHQGDAPSFFSISSAIALRPLCAHGSGLGPESGAGRGGFGACVCVWHLTEEQPGHRPRTHPRTRAPSWPPGGTRTPRGAGMPQAAPHWPPSRTAHHPWPELGDAQWAFALVGVRALAAACASEALPRVCMRCAHAVCCVYALGAAAS